MSKAQTVTLKPRKARPFFGRHPWVFQGAIDKVDPGIQPGDLVRVMTHDREFVAYGLYNPESNIRVRLYSWDKDRPVDEAMIVERIERAVRMRREELGFSSPRSACRLVYSESDCLSGLIVDRYADALVVQFTSLAMSKFSDAVVATLQRLCEPSCIFRRTERGIGELEGLDLDDVLLAGSIPADPVVIEENGVELLVDIAAGQKTGAFLDQRDNRAALCRYTAGRSVLDLFCYSGGFSLTALKQGQARQTLGIDVSGPAIALAQRNAKHNGLAAEFRQQEVVPALEDLKREQQKFGVVICDPPKFARTAGAVENAVKGYDHLHRLSLEVLEPGGILMACSCSGHMSADLFMQTLAGAAQKVGREVQILEQRGQAPDHPVSVFCLETNYLKCVIARAVDL